jgi:hypothetical protein
VPAAPKVLTQRHLNRALLARQLLLERAKVTVPTALERMAGLQAQYPPAMYVGLWSRVRDLERAAVTRALEQALVAQGTLQRSTIHLVAKDDYWPFAVAVRDERRAQWLKAALHTADDGEMQLIAKRLRARLRQQSPITRKDVEAIAGDPYRTNGVNLWLDLVRAPPSGTWERRKADLFAAARDWFGPPPDDLDPPAATAHIVRRYLAGFGPSSVDEIASWAGLKPKIIANALTTMTTRSFRAEDGDELFDVPRAPLPDPDTPAPVRFLPVWDATLLVHARRALVIREADRPRIFNTKTPHSMNTFLVDGQVAGTWRYDKGAVTTELFPDVKLTKQLRREVDDEAARLAHFHD